MWTDGSSSEHDAHWDLSNNEPNGGTGENCAHIRPASLHFKLNDRGCGSNVIQALCDLGTHC